MLVQLKQSAVCSLDRAISSQPGDIVFRQRRHFFDRDVPAEEPQLRGERRAVTRARFHVDAKSRMRFRSAVCRRADDKQSGQRDAFHGGLIKGLTISATPKAFGAD